MYASAVCFFIFEYDTRDFWYLHFAPIAECVIRFVISNLNKGGKLRK